MSRCPVCGSFRIVVVVSSTKRAFCSGCGSRWVQRGSEQLLIERGYPSSLPVDSQPKAGVPEQTR